MLPYGRFHLDQIVVNLLGLIAGIPLGYALLAGMFYSVNQQMDIITLPVVFKPSSCLLTVALCVAMCAAAQLVVLRLIKKMDWWEALKIKE